MLDISLSAKKSQFCNGWSRRDFIRVGALAPFGLSLGKALALESTAPSRVRNARAKSVILVFLGGGISHHDTFDLKPDAAEEVRGKYKGIPSKISGLHVGELLPKLAGTMNRLALVRSQQHGNDHHETATNWGVAGKFGSAFGDHLAMGAVGAYEAAVKGL